MDQLKEFLRQAIKYRFWIVVGVAALLPLAAYFSAHGALTKEYEEGAGAVKSASSDVKQYENGVIPSDEYKTLTDQRTESLTKDINQAWKILYDQQAPLLTWPEEVSERFMAWGRKWPENVDAAAVQQAILDYIQVYPRQVDTVYSSFRPFDYESGEGIVVAPVKQALLRPASFNMAKPPSLGQVWGAQQKLWIQWTVLDVINSVNTKAKDWDGAPVKQITALEVANPKAQDQQSAVKAEELVLAPEIVKPGSESSASSTSATPAASSSGGYESMMQSSMGSSMDMSMMSGGGATTKPEEVYVFKGASDTQPFQEVPVFVSVLIDQRRMLDLLAAFENSPMSIRVVDFEMSRPQQRVQKPVKGEDNPVFAGGMGMMGNEMILGSSYGMMSRSGRGSMMEGGMGMGMSEMNMMQSMAAASRGMGGMMGGDTGPAKKAGTDIRSDQLKKLQAKKDQGKEDEAKKKEEGSRGGFSDPYYDIVEVRVYGKARFYNPPPPEPAPAATDSTGAAPTDATTTTPTEGAVPADATATPPAEGAAPAEGAVPAEPAKGDEPAKGEPPAAEPTPAGAAEPGKTEAPAAEPAPGGTPAPPAAEGSEPAADAPPAAAPGTDTDEPAGAAPAPAGEPAATPN